MREPITPNVQFVNFEDMCNTQVDLCKVLQAALKSHVPNDGGFYVLALMEQIASKTFDVASNEFSKDAAHKRDVESNEFGKDSAHKRAA